MRSIRGAKRGSFTDAPWILFLFLPFFAGAYSVWNYRAAWAKNVLWAFIIFYGATFSVSKETTGEGKESDIARYVYEVKTLYREPLTIKSALAYFYETGEADILRTVIAIVVSRVSDSQNVLTAVYAFIFGFFLTRNMWYLFSWFRGQMTPYVVLLLAAFFLVNPFWSINGFRFNTAIHIYFYGLLPFLFEGKKKGILISASSILVHFSFLLPVVIMFVYVFARNRMNVYFAFFMLSLFSQEVNVSAFNQVVEENLPEAFVERSSYYRDSEIVTEFRGRDEYYLSEGKSKNWYAVWYQQALLWTLTAVTILLFVLYRNAILSNKALLNIYCFTLLFWGFSNVMRSLPSGGRFLSIASLFSLASVILFLRDYPKQKYVNDLLFICTPALLLFIIVSTRVGFYSLSVTTFLGNPLLLLFSDYNIALNDLIK